MQRIGALVVLLLAGAAACGEPGRRAPQDGGGGQGGSPATGGTGGSAGSAGGKAGTDPDAGVTDAAGADAAGADAALADAVNADAAALTSGALDPAFGVGGKSTSAGIGSTPTAMAVDGQGRVLMVGGTTLARYGVDGALDGTFGQSGLVPVPFVPDTKRGSADAVFGVVAQPDGKVVVVGSHYVGPNATDLDFAVARFETNGTPDGTFGQAGWVTTDFLGGADRASRVVVQGDGGLIVGGAASSNATLADMDFALARYDAAGTLDATFGSEGKLHTNVVGRFDNLQALALGKDGSIVAAGRAAPDGGSDPVLGVVQYDAKGAPDATFGKAGVLQTNFGLKAWAEGTDAAVDGDGRIVLTLLTRATSGWVFTLARLLPTGTLDAAFGNKALGVAGLATAPFSTQSDRAIALAIAADGKIVAIGRSAEMGPNPNWAVARFTPDGLLDDAFGAGGMTTVDFFGAIDTPVDVGLTPTGAIVIGGVAKQAPPATELRLALARLLP